MIHVKLLQPKALIPLGAKDEPMIHCGMTPVMWTIKGFECTYSVKKIADRYDVNIKYNDPFKNSGSMSYVTMPEVIDAINEHNERNITDILNRLTRTHDDVLNFCHDHYNED